MNSGAAPGVADLGTEIVQMGNGYANAAAFRSAAADGEFGVDPDAAHAVLSRIRAGKDAVESLLSSAQSMATPPQLGANPVGEAIAGKYAQRVDGGGESYSHALRNLHEQYSDAEQGILTAMRSYQDFEESTANALHGQA